MADSLRQKLVDALLARLRAILVANGYETNLGRNVVEWRNLETQPWAEGDFIDESGQSIVNVKDKAEPGDDSTIQGRHSKDLQFELDVATKKAVASSALDPGTGDATLTIAHQVRKLIADIEKSLGGQGTWLTTVTIHKISALSVNDMDVTEAGNVLGHARLQFSIQYSSRRFDPYQQ